MKDLSGERRSKLNEALQLFMLHREVSDLEQWIAEREVVAGSHELGQDYEHITLLWERFNEFARETRTIGNERVMAVNEIADHLISIGHSDSAQIAEWKDSLDEVMLLLEPKNCHKGFSYSKIFLIFFFSKLTLTHEYFKNI